MAGTPIESEMPAEPIDGSVDYYDATVDLLGLYGTAYAAAVFGDAVFELSEAEDAAKGKLAVQAAFQEWAGKNDVKLPEFVIRPTPDVATVGIESISDPITLREVRQARSKLRLRLAFTDGGVTDPISELKTGQLIETVRDMEERYHSANK